MTQLVAKQILKDQSWVIVSDDVKVGNIQANAHGFEVKIGEEVHTFSTTKSIEKGVQITFEKPLKAKKSRPVYAIWPTPAKTYNDYYDVTQKFHVFTKTKSSKCYHVAGYFNIDMNGSYQRVFCPKLIFVQRYKYDGPYETESMARGRLNML